MKVNHLQLPEILSLMYKEFTEYPISLAQLDEPAIESLSFVLCLAKPSQSCNIAFGTDIALSLKHAIEETDLLLLDRYRK